MHKSISITSFSEGKKRGNGERNFAKKLLPKMILGTHTQDYPENAVLLSVGELLWTEAGILPQFHLVLSYVSVCHSILMFLITLNSAA